MNVPVEHNLHSCSRLFRFLLPLFPNETLLRLSVTRLTSAVTGSAAAAAAPRTDFFSDAHADSLSSLTATGCSPAALNGFFLGGFDICPIPRPRVGPLHI